MFGYLQPLKDELRLKDFQLYKSVYCGLCRHLGKDYGILSRMTLSYDCTVLAMLSMSLNHEKCSVTKGRCTCNPAKKCMFCDSDGESFALAGAVSVIMSYYKMKDTIQDSGFFKKTAAFFIKAVLHRNYKKAAKKYPKIDELVSDMMKHQLEAEKNDAGVDVAAEPTAKLISALCKEFSPDESQTRVLEVFGYFVGRWIYLIDAADDLEKDMKHKNFNPFSTKVQENISDTMTYCNEVLNMTASQLVLSYELLEIDQYKEILNNIIYAGIPSMQKKCLFDKYEKTKTTDYYEALTQKTL